MTFLDFGAYLQANPYQWVPTLNRIGRTSDDIGIALMGYHLHPELQLARETGKR
jgi:hypothetical protein